MESISRRSSTLKGHWRECAHPKLLLCEILMVRGYFEDARIKQLATQLYERVDWLWTLNGGKTLSMGWQPETGFLDARWSHYCELMMIYLLAIGSPSHPVAPEYWSNFTRPVIHYAGLDYISGNGPIFTHQYSQAWCDFRDKKDAYVDYFANSIKATRAQGILSFLSKLVQRKVLRSYSV
jgi:hypothetical protein